MFIPSLPDVKRLPKSCLAAWKSWDAAVTQYATIAAQYHDVSSDAASAAALEADTALVLEAVKSDGDVMTVGTPNQSERLTRIAALSRAMTAAESEVIARTITLNESLHAARAEIVATFAADAEKAAAEYAAAVEVLATKRETYTRALDEQAWAYSVPADMERVESRTVLPHLGDTGDRPLSDVYGVVYNVVNLLRLDAQEHAKAANQYADAESRRLANLRADAMLRGPVA